MCNENVTRFALSEFSGRNGFLEGNFLFRISEKTQRESKLSFRKLQIVISQTADFHFANYRFSFRKLQIFISQTTDSHFANYRFSFHKLQIFFSQTTDFNFVSFHFISFRFATYGKPVLRRFSGVTQLSMMRRF